MPKKADIDAGAVLMQQIQKRCGKNNPKVAQILASHAAMTQLNAYLLSTLPVKGMAVPGHGAAMSMYGVPVAIDDTQKQDLRFVP